MTTQTQPKSLSSLLEQSAEAWTKAAAARREADQADRDVTDWLNSLGGRRVLISGTARGKVHYSTIQPLSRYILDAVGMIAGATFCYNDHFRCREDRVHIRLQDGTYVFKISDLKVELVDEV